MGCFEDQMMIIIMMVKKKSSWNLLKTVGIVGPIFLFCFVSISQFFVGCHLTALQKGERYRDED